MLRSLTIFCAAVALAGCASVTNNYTPVTQQVSFPTLNERHFATLGDELLSQGTATTTQGIVLTARNNIGGFILSPGFYPQVGVEDDYVFTSFATGNARAGLGTVSLEGGLLGQITLPRGIRFSRSEQQTCVIVPNIYGFSQPVCDTEYSYRYTEMPFVSDNDFQQTLIYSGRIGDRIKISYREFSGGMARSAFTNDAEYDLSASDIIAYRGARVRVLNADNERIEYEVLSNFNSSP